MDPARSAAALDDEIARIEALLRDASPHDWSRSLPTCPRWELADLVGHLGGVHRWVVGAVREGHGRTESTPPQAEGLAEWFGEGARELRETIAVDPATPAWTFERGDRTVGFWQRRQVHEHTVHRVDVELALVGETSPVPVDVAADGVAEVVEVFVPRRLAKGWLDPIPAAVRLVATDAPVDVVVGDGDPVTQVSAPAADLYLALWRRAPLDDERTTYAGDEVVAREVLRMPLTP
ncbi:maleylpyruvate isomerase family mycothiol-dependent enzyme [Janibacter melonis]|uniref:maleylpyruvate isomerase family mycothiol-dependent enzyme n=1 Tax=Janibacter melonis TaxID=262209 RepID=UPI001919E3F2|nr:maleylpyruvate isomerase family mycothiol-dependent enzyme [Janibacter melonis]